MFTDVWEKVITLPRCIVAHVERRIISYRGRIKFTIGEHIAEFIARDQYIISKSRDRFREERDQIETILNAMQPGDVFYDIGANTGLYACFVANNRPDCYVVAFEPYHPNLSELRRNADLNDIENIEMLEFALSNIPGKATLSTPPNSRPGHGTGSINTDDGDAVQTIRGDQLIADEEVPPPNIVKIDVEGAEGLVLDGIRKALSDNSCRMVLCELHPDELSERGPSVEEIEFTFEEMGYQVEKHDRWGKPRLIKAYRSS